ncbi:terminase TerL endonuclease subunit [uncultured Selenomonas sp.]|uniref:terminase large subunit n=1 Tax=uncultured Selenomonas sp. TaxID=159275 RepID=UPI0028DBBAAD|nr:terminase TerL endonuclease subunit [uncultured Selenomonas sp.]
MSANWIAAYHAKIASGEITVGEKVRKLYEHLTQKLEDKSGQYVFDEERANHAIIFIERFCKHSKGKWAGKPVLLELWQKALLSALFGFVDRETGRRQYRELLLIVARKNGKSTLAAGIGVYMLMADGESGPEIYSAATKRDQAKIIWSESVRMIQKSPALGKRCKCLVSKIRCGFNDGVFAPLASDTNNQDGLNIHGALIDELHAIKDKNTYDVLVDGMSAREQPLCVITSTAGTVRDNIYDLKYDEGASIVAGYGDPEGYHDETVLPVIYELDKRSEWTDSACWQKANPALGTIKSTEQLRGKVERAKANSIYVKNLLCKDFNVRETATEAFLTFEQLNNEDVFELDALHPRYAIGGIDLSATTDLTCATLLFKVADDTAIYVRQMYWIPEDLLQKRVHEDRVPYDVWQKRGFLRTSPGNSIDYRLIVEWFQEQQMQHDIYLYKVGYDSWSAKYFVQNMQDVFGETVMQPVIQGKKTLSGPMKSLAADLEAKAINYGNNPVLKWCMANVCIDIDRNGNIQPTKGISPKHRIDGFASLLDAYVVYCSEKEAYENLI